MKKMIQFLKLLLSSGLICIIGATAFTKRQVENLSYGELLNFITPIHYDVDIHFEELFKKGTNNFSGKCVINIKIDSRTWSIMLHAQRSHIKIQDNVQLVEKNSNKTYISTNDHVLLYQGDRKSYVITFYFEELIFSGNYSLHIPYNGSLDDDGGFFKTSYVNHHGRKMWVVGTKTFKARQLFPCFDKPSLKATFSINIKHDNSYEHSSSLPIRTVKIDKNHMQWTRFEITSAISTYRIGFILHDLHITDVNLWFRLQSKDYLIFARNIIKKVTTSFQNWKIWKNVPNIFYFAIPGFQYNSIEKWNLNFYRETAIIYNSNVDSTAQKIEVAFLLARNVIHQRLDNQINSIWSYSWLIKGLAMLLGTNITNECFPQLRMMDLFVVQIQQESLRLDSIIGSLTSKALDESFRTNPFLDANCPFEINCLSPSYYAKAPAILRMLQHILTDKVFRNGIERFYNTMIYGTKESTIFDEFWRAMQEAHDNEIGISNEYRLNIKEKMDPWTKLNHYPILMVRQINYTVIVTIENINSLNLDRNLSVLVTVTRESAPNFASMHTDRRYEKWITSFDKPIYFVNEINEWIIINLQQIGYYRVNYQTDNWLKIARYLNSENYTKIHVLNRAQIIDDAYYFVKTGQMNLSLFLNITEYLSRERNYIAWYPMFKALEDMSTIFFFSSKEYIKVKVLKNLYSLLRHIKMDETPDDDELTKCLRQEAVKWYCVLGDSNCIEIAEMQLQDYLTHSRYITKFLPMWKEWTYCNGLAGIAHDNWYTVSKSYLLPEYKIRDKKILKFLSCSQNYTLIKHLLLKYETIMEDIITKEYSGKELGNFHINYFYNVIQKHARHEIILNYILQNFIKVKPRQFKTLTALNIIINHVYSEYLLNKITQYLENDLETLVQELIYIDQDFYVKKLGIVIRTLIEEQISFVRTKINVRLSQIKRQMNHFHLITNKK